MACVQCSERCVARCLKAPDAKSGCAEGPWAIVDKLSGDAHHEASRGRRAYKQAAIHVPVKRHRGSRDTHVYRYKYLTRLQWNARV